jgi:hypothetical protein
LGRLVEVCHAEFSSCLHWARRAMLLCFCSVLVLTMLLRMQRIGHRRGRAMMRLAGHNRGLGRAVTGAVVKSLEVFLPC